MATHIRTYGRPIKLNVSKTLSANNTTESVPLFRITGAVEVLKLYGVVTTVLGANHTGAFWRLNDQTAQVDISLSTGGATLSAAPVGTIVSRDDTAAGANVARVMSSAAGTVADNFANTSGLANVCTTFRANAKAGANTDIEYRYTTTDAPTSGVIQFFIEYIPLSASGAIATV